MKFSYSFIAMISVLLSGCATPAKTRAPVIEKSHMADPIDEPLTKKSRCDAYCASEIDKHKCKEACNRGQEYEG